MEASGPQGIHLHELLKWRPGWVADPAPEIFAIIRDLDRGAMVRTAAVMLETQIRVEEARLDGLRQIHKILSDAHG